MWDEVFGLMGYVWLFCSGGGGLDLVKAGWGVMARANLGMLGTELGDVDGWL